MPPTAPLATDPAAPTSPERKPMRLPLVFLFGFLASLVVVGGLIWFFAAYEAGRLWPFAYNPRINQNKWFEVIRNAVTTAAALGVGITLFFSYRRQQTAEHNQRVAAEAQLTAAKAQQTAAAALELSTKQHALDQDRRKDAVTAELRTRYAQTAEQLGSSHLPVRLAGIYSLAALADDWADMGNEDERQVCLDLLCAYFRSEQPGEDPVVSSELAEATLRLVQERLGISVAPRKSWAHSQILLKNLGHVPKLHDIMLKRGGHLSMPAINKGGFAIWRNILLIEGQLDITLYKLNSALAIHGARVTKGRLSVSVSYDFPDETDKRTTRLELRHVTFEGGAIELNLPGCNVIFADCTFRAGELSVNTQDEVTSPDDTDSITFENCVFESDVFSLEDLAGYPPMPTLEGVPDALSTSALKVSKCRFANNAPVLVSAGK
ncbi:UNVERIFIED_ORG: hypothetical protein J2X79_000228 [Arthrobacter globiformis]|nr:hypothetical protein [Arthrobacter globiformis]